MIGTLKKVKKDDFLELDLVELDRCVMDGVVASVVRREKGGKIEKFLVIDGGGDDLILLKNQ